MGTEKAIGNDCENMSRRTCLTAALTLFGLMHTSTNALAVTLSFERKTIAIDDNYVLVDGWLLRTDDLTQQVKGNVV